MSRFDAQAIAEMVKMTLEMFTDAGFTGMKMEPAPMSDTVIASFREEDPDDVPDPVEFGKETHYHRVTADQGNFGIWFEPYVTLDLHGTGVDIRSLLPPGASTEGMPEGWSLIGLDEGVPEKLFVAFSKNHREP